mgnify:CR=1 FL=1
MTKRIVTTRLYSRETKNLADIAALTAYTGAQEGYRATVSGTRGGEFELILGVNPEAGNAIQGVEINSVLSGFTGNAYTAAQSIQSGSAQ